MFTRTAEAEWRGTLRNGAGSFVMPHGQGSTPYSFQARFSDKGSAGQNSPEELIAAAHASCFSMALSGLIEQAGFTPERIHTRAQVHLERKDSGFAIDAIDLETEARVPGMEAAQFQTQADLAKRNCPVSQALAAVREIRLKARLI